MRYLNFHILGIVIECKVTVPCCYFILFICWIILIWHRWLTRIQTCNLKKFIVLSVKWWALILLRCCIVNAILWEEWYLILSLVCFRQWLILNNWWFRTGLKFTSVFFRFSIVPAVSWKRTEIFCILISFGYSHHAVPNYFSCLSVLCLINLRNQVQQQSLLCQMFGNKVLLKILR